jgi:hypothetical protein
VSEHLQMKEYGPDRQRFRNLEALMGAQSAVCFVWAYAILLLQRWRGGTSSNGSNSKQQAQALPPWTVYWRPALTNSIGPACGLIALKNISYPAQVCVCVLSCCCLSVCGTHKLSQACTLSCGLCSRLPAPHSLPAWFRCWPSRARWCP